MRYGRADALQWWSVKRLAVAVVGMLLGLAVAPGAAQGEPTAPIEVRVWQDVGDELDIYVSARPAAGSWGTLGTIPLALDDGISSSGQYRYGDISLDVPLLNRATPATVEVRVWQDVRGSERIYVSARPAGGSWSTLGTIRLLLDDGVSSSGVFRFGDISLDVPLPAEEVGTLAGYAGDWGFADGRGTEARFGRQYERSFGDLKVDVAPDGSVIVADPANTAVRRVAPDGTVTTVAGRHRGFLPAPVDVAVDAEGSIYVASRGDGLIRKFSSDGRVTRVIAGGGPETPAFEPPPPSTAEEAYFWNIKGIALGPQGDLYVIEQEQIRRLSSSGWVTTIAGGSGLGHVDGPGAQAQFHRLQDIAVDDDGNVYVIDLTYVLGRGAVPAIRKVDTDGVVSTLYRGEHPAFGGALAGATGLTLSDDGEVLISNTGRHQIVRLTADGTLQGIAGSGEDGYLDGPRDATALSLPGSLALLPGGGLVVADQSGSLLRVIAPDADGSALPEIALAAGKSVPLLEGVQVSAYIRNLSFYPGSMALDESGHVVVSDPQFSAVRRVSPDGAVATLAGANGTGFRDGAGDEAQFDGPGGLAIAPDGSIYVADYGNDSIREIAADGSVTTVLFPEGFEIPRPGALAIDGNGNLLVAQLFPGRLVRLSPSGEASVLLDGGLQFIHGIAVSDDGDAYLTARRHERAVIVRVTPDGGISTVFQGAREEHGGIFTLDVEGIAVAGDGTLYVVDSGYGRVVRISPDGSVAIVVEQEAFSRVRNEVADAILLAPDGSLLVSTIDAIWKITLPDE